MQLNSNNTASFLDTMAHYIESKVSKKEFAEVVKCYESNRDTIDNAGESSVGTVLRNVAIAYASLSQYPVALQKIRLAQNIVTRDGDSLLLAEIFVTLAGILRDTGNYREAKVAFQDAESIFRRNDCLEGQSRALNLLAGLHFRLNDFNNSLTVLMDAIEIARKLGDKSKLAFMISNIGRVCTFVGDFSEARKHITNGIELSKEMNDNLETARGLLSLSYLFIQNGSYAKAEKHLEEAHSYLEQCDSKRDEVIYLTYLGELRYRTNRNFESEETLSQALRMSDAISPNSTLSARVRRHLAELYLRTSELRKAERMCSAALKVVDNLNCTVEQGALLKIRAAVASLRGNGKQAQELFDQAFNKLAESGVRFEKVDALILAGNCKTFSPHRRMTYLFRAEEFFAGNKIPNRLPEVHKLISDLNVPGISADLPEENITDPNAVKVDYLTLSPEIITFKEQLPLIGKTDIAILLTGETGVGKDHMARYFHSLACPGKPFKAINCASVPETLLESELFGYVRGAFTGADNDKEGLFVAANGGVLYLDEIGDMPISLQSKLLGVLEHRRVIPLGSTTEVSLDIKLIAATNRNLEEMVEDGTFRRDLYYRLSGIVFNIPALRDRKEDIPLLLTKFLEKSGLCQKGTPLQAEMVHQFVRYDWPGNVRELANKVKRLEIMRQLVAEGDLVELARSMFDDGVSAETSSLFDRVEEFERNLIMEALLASGGNKSEAARILGIHEATVRTKLKRYNLSTNTIN